MHTVEQCTNKIGFSMPYSKIIFYKDPDTQKIYCFDISDATSIIASGINPFTSKKISKEFIQELILMNKDLLLKRGFAKLSGKNKYLNELKKFEIY